MPIVNFKEYQLEGEVNSCSKTYWRPIGLKGPTKEYVKRFLDSNLYIFNEYPNIKYRIVEIVHYKPDHSVIEEGVRGI